MREFRLSKTQEFQKLKSNGFTLKFNFLLLNYLPSEKSFSRLGWTVSRNIGCSVVRNRLKRWCREYHKNLLENFRCPVDINIVFLRKSDEFYKTMDFQRIKRELDGSLSKLRSSL